jgi:hypothetical protein
VRHNVDVRIVPGYQFSVVPDFRRSLSGHNVSRLPSRARWSDLL